MSGERGAWKRLSVLGGILCAAAAAVTVVLRRSPDSNPASEDPALQICRTVLDDVRFALYCYRTDLSWDWDAILDHCSRTKTGTDELRDEFRRVRRQPEWTAREETDRALRSSASLHTLKSELFGTLRPFGRGAYRIELRDNDDDGDPLHDRDAEVEAFITGIAEDGRLRTLHARLRYAEAVYSPPSSIHARGSAILEGSIRLEGTRGGVSLDGDLLLLGTPSCEGPIRSTRDVQIRGAPSLPSDPLLSRTPIEPIPDIIPEVYRSQAGFILTRKGEIRDAKDLAVADVSKGESWHGLSWQAARGWSLEDASPLPQAIYFVEGDLIAVSLGRRGEEQATFITTGSVTLEGSLRLRAHLPGTLILSGGDLSIHASSAMRLQGTLAAREQARIGGGGAIFEGAVVVSDTRDLLNLVSRTRVDSLEVALRIGGAVRIRYPAPAVTSIKAPLSAIPVVEQTVLP